MHALSHRLIAPVLALGLVLSACGQPGARSQPAGAAPRAAAEVSPPAPPRVVERSWVDRLPDADRREVSRPRESAVSWEDRIPDADRQIIASAVDRPSECGRERPILDRFC